MGVIATVLFALAVSTDGFMVGLAYGTRKINIPAMSLSIIALASALAVAISMLAGKVLAYIIPEAWNIIIGASILIIIGFYFLLGASKDKIGSLPTDEDGQLISFKVRPLGIMVQILKEPVTADFDGSGVISMKEAFILGLALALDALGAGFALAMSGASILFTTLTVGVLKFILVNSGLFLGKFLTNTKFKTVLPFFPGLIFITLGLLEIYKR